MLHGVSSKSLIWADINKNKKIKVTMASEQVIATEAIAKAGAEVTRTSIQAMAAAVAERP